MASSAGVDSTLLVLLAQHPASDKRRLARLLSEQGYSLDPSKVNRRLYALERQGRVRKVEASPPLWLLAGTSTPPASGHSGKTTLNGIQTAQRTPGGKGSPLPAARAVRTGKRLRPWQETALAAWEDNGHRGVVQAVTGTGKTQIGIEAAYGQLARGGKVLILVPTRALLTQWERQLVPVFGGGRVGLRGDGQLATFRDRDILVSTVHSAVDGVPLHGAPGLLIADECHRYGAASWGKALDPSFGQRLGLSATYKRGDSGDALVLAPYFGAKPVYDIGFKKAIRQGVVAPFRMAFVGVRLSPQQRDDYDRFSSECGSARHKLIQDHDLPAEPFGDFMKAVSAAADGKRGGDAQRLAWKYTSNFSKRRALLADSPGKLNILRSLTPAMSRGSGTLIFTQTKAAAVKAAEQLGRLGHPSAAIYGELDGGKREALLHAFQRGDKTVLTAPRVLDEGIDVPNADLGVVIAASSSQRQMIQRMGRTLRLSPTKKFARLVIVFAEDTNEDPRNGAHEGFIDLAWDVADRRQVFDSRTTAEEIITFLTKR